MPLPMPSHSSSDSCPSPRTWLAVRCRPSRTRSSIAIAQDLPQPRKGFRCLTLDGPHRTAQQRCGLSFREVLVVAKNDARALPRRQPEHSTPDLVTLLVRRAGRFWFDAPVSPNSNLEGQPAKPVLPQIEGDLAEVGPDHLIAQPFQLGCEADERLLHEVLRVLSPLGE